VTTMVYHNFLNSDKLILTKTLSYSYKYFTRINEFNINLHRNDTLDTYRIDLLMMLCDNDNYFDRPKTAPIWIYDYSNMNNQNILRPFDTIENTCNWMKSYLLSMDGILTSLKNLLKYDYFNVLQNLPKHELYCYVYTNIERDDDLI